MGCVEKKIFLWKDKTRKTQEFDPEWGEKATNQAKSSNFLG